MSSKRYKLAYMPIEDSDQHAHLHILIRVYNGHSIGSQGSNVSSSGVKLRLSPDCVRGGPNRMFCVCFCVCFFSVFS